VKETKEELRPSEICLGNSSCLVPLLEYSYSLSKTDQPDYEKFEEVLISLNLRSPLSLRLSIEIEELLHLGLISQNAGGKLLA